MRFDKPLLEGTLIRRYKRFLADVELDDGTQLTVHCANSGAMTSCSDPGSRVVISDSENPSRKLRHSLELVRCGRTWVGVNTMHPNRAVEGFIRRQRIAELRGYDTVRREVKYGIEGRSRIDLLLSCDDGRLPDCYVEIKNSTLRCGEHAAFPDAITERGLKHLLELEAEVEVGQRAVLFFFIGRADVSRWRPADEVDSTYGKTLRQVAVAGVEILAYGMRLSRRGIELRDRLPVDLDLEGKGGKSW